MAGPVLTTQEFARHPMKAQAPVSALADSTVPDNHAAADILQTIDTWRLRTRRTGHLDNSESRKLTPAEP